MLERKKPRYRRAGVRGGAIPQGEGWWIVMDSTTWSDGQSDSNVFAALAHQPSNSFDNNATHPKDERQLVRRINSLLRTHLRQPGAAERPLPIYLRGLADMLLGTPRKPLAQAILALHLTRLHNGRVFVLTEEVRSGLGSRLVADLRHRGVSALLVTHHAPESGTSGDPARIDTLLHPGDVVIGLHGNSLTYASVREATKDAGATFVVLGAEQDRGEKDVCAIACGSGKQVLDARLFFSHLICTVLGDLEARTRSNTRAMRLRQVS
jgi:hypothetical protein